MIDAEWEKEKRAYRHSSMLVEYDGFNVDFSDDFYRKATRGKTGIKYDEFLNIQRNSKPRGGLEDAYLLSGYADIKGKLVSVFDGTALFEKAFLSITDISGDIHDCVEQYLVVKDKKFSEFSSGDCVSFFAEIEPFITDNRSLEYKVSKCDNITKIDEYELPTEEEMRAQFLREIICDACPISDQCDRVVCIME